MEAVVPWADPGRWGQSVWVVDGEEPEWDVPGVVVAVVVGRAGGGGCGGGC